MPDCAYCGDSFADESAYLDHLRSAHGDELGPIDRRRVEADAGGGLDLPTGPLALGLVLAVAAGVAAFVILGVGSGSGGDGPRNLGSVHYHGTMVVVIDGEPVDFSRSEYQLQADAFHYEGGDGTTWHVHAQGVTLQWALASLGIEVTADRVTIDGRTYLEDDPGTTISITVNGEPVAPSNYVLREGDAVRVAVEIG